MLFTCLGIKKGACGTPGKASILYTPLDSTHLHILFQVCDIRGGNVNHTGT